MMYFMFRTQSNFSNGKFLKHFNKQGLNFFFFLLDSKRCENENESLDDQAEEMDKAGVLCKIFCPNREMS